MRNKLILTLGFAAALMIASDANAQSRTRTAAVQPAQPCLKALDGSCVKGYIVEATRQRAAIIPSVRVSYFGTPQGSIGGPVHSVRAAVPGQRRAVRPADRRVRGVRHASDEVG